MFKELNTLKVFFEEPTREFNVREVARILKISPATASKELKEMTKKGLLNERHERVLKLYKANLEGDFYKDLKVFYNIRKIKESGLIDAMNKFYLKPAIVLFGSYANGSDIETSDIDLLIMSENTKDLPELKTFEKKLKTKVHLFICKELKDLKNEQLVNNILNGIMIQGKIKWI